jgi:O-antigen/teichoic acid export membrane protein
MGALKQLAGETALYGVSSIFGRLLNYFLVPLHTAIFIPSEFGSITLLYSYVAVFNVLYTYGLETAYFRFITKSKDPKIYDLACTSVLSSSLVFSAILIYFAPDIARLLGEPGKGYIIQWLAVILFVDAFSSIPFAKLRIENRPLKFVIAKLGNILLIVFFNILFLLVFKGIYEERFLVSLKPFIGDIYTPGLGIGYVFLANLLGSAGLLFFLFSEIKKFSFYFNWTTLKPILIYSIPIMITGLSGMLNDNLDKIMIASYLPADFYPQHNPQGALGIYGAVFKLSVFMMLGIQAFRYAGEPFFFSQAERRDSAMLYASVFHYFVVAGSVLMIAVSVNADLIAFVFLRNPEFRLALYLLPYLLLAKLFFGMYINISIWYKLTDKTMYGVYFSVAGTIITLVLNLILLPIIGYLGSAIAMLSCYSSMCVLAYYFGQRIYPVPYKLWPVFAYLAISTIFSVGSFFVQHTSFAVDSALNIAFTIVFTGIIFLFEKKRWKRNHA